MLPGCLFHGRRHTTGAQDAASRWARYRIFIDALRDKLKDEVLPATWAALSPHAERQALFLVEGETDLLDVAVAVADDDQAAVKRWVDDGSLRRPTPDETKGWDADPVAFHAIIVQPFVLCRPIEIEPAQG